MKNVRSNWEAAEFRNQLAESAVVCEGAEIKSSVMEEHTRLKPFCEVRNSTIGAYTIVSSYSIINGSHLGKFCSVGPGVFAGLWEHNQWVSTHSFYLSEACGGFVKGFGSYVEDDISCQIGNDVWMGANAVILKGAQIGDGAIVGAGSVVTKDIPPYAVAVGNPARVIRYRFDQADIDFLLRLKWWNFDRDTLQRMVDAQVWDSIDKVKQFSTQERKASTET